MENDICIWDKTLKASLKAPFVKVNREEFLLKELRRYCDEGNMEKAILYPPSVLSKKQIDTIANGCIKYHLTIVCSTSALSGIPGGWFMAATLPADIIQFYAHVLALTQKLAYLYGSPDFSNEKGDLDDESLQILTVFIGAMMGVDMAIKNVGKLTAACGGQVAKRLPRMALTKYAPYNVTKEIAKWLGVKLTKTTFARGCGKMIPLVGAPISATVTYYTFKPMACKLKKHLEENIVFSVS